MVCDTHTHTHIHTLTHTHTHTHTHSHTHKHTHTHTYTHSHTHTHTFTESHTHTDNTPTQTNCNINQHYTSLTGTKHTSIVVTVLIYRQTHAQCQWPLLFLRPASSSSSLTPLPTDHTTKLTHFELLFILPFLGFFIGLQLLKQGPCFFLRALCNRKTTALYKSSSDLISNT